MSEISKQDSVDVREFNDQAFLIWKNIVTNEGQSSECKLEKFSRNKGPIIHKIVDDYTPSTIVSKMMKNDNIDLYKNFLDLETHKLTALQAELKAYKIEESEYVPFYFPTAAERVTRQSILETGTTAATVIKSFNVQYLGKDTFTADKSIKCTLDLHTDNIKNLFNEPPPGYAKTVELFTIFRNKTAKLSEGLKTKKKVPATQLNKARSSQIAITLGYNPPSIESGSRSLFTRDEIDAIKNSKLSLRLTYVDHTIQVQENGAANVTIEFIGRMSSIVRDPAYDLMSTTTDIIERSKMDTELKNLSKKPDQNKKKIQEIKNQVLVANRLQFRSYLLNLENKGLLYDEPISISEIEGFKRYGLTGKDLERKISEEVERKSGALSNPVQAVYDSEGSEGLEKLRDKSLKKPSTEGSTITEVRESLVDELQDAESILKNLARVAKTLSYFHLGDLIAAVIEETHTRIEAAIDELSRSSDDDAAARAFRLVKALQDLEDFKIMFASVQISTSEDRMKSINLADIPITAALYQKFVFERIEQRHVVKYNLNSFLQDCVTYFIPKSLKGHVVRDAPFLENRTSVKSFEVSGENIDNSKITIRSKNLPSMLKRIPAKNLRDQTDYMVIYSEQDAENSFSRGGNRAKDHRDGIYHFHIGRSRGVLKSISFSKQEIMYRKEALMLNSVSLFDQLKMPYNIAIEMYGNSVFLPGSMIFVDPSNLGLGSGRSRDSAAFQLGLGGYYQLIGISTSYSNGRMSTSATGVFVSWAESESGILEELSSAPKPSDRSPGSAE